MKMLRHSVAAATLLFLMVACSTLGVPTPQGFNEKLASGYTSVTTIAQTARSLLVAKVITADDAENVAKQATTAKEGLDIARSLHGTVPTAADQRLQASLVVLSALDTYLKKRGVK